MSKWFFFMLNASFLASALNGEKFPIEFLATISSNGIISEEEELEVIRKYPMPDNQIPDKSIPSDPIPSNSGITD